MLQKWGQRQIYCYLTDTFKEQLTPLITLVALSLTATEDAQKSIDSFLLFHMLLHYQCLKGREVLWVRQDWDSGDTV